MSLNLLRILTYYYIVPQVFPIETSGIYLFPSSGPQKITPLPSNRMGSPKRQGGHRAWQDQDLKGGTQSTLSLIELLGFKTVVCRTSTVIGSFQNIGRSLKVDVTNTQLYNR